MRHNAALARKVVFLLRRWARDWGGVLTILFGLWAAGYVLWLSLSGSSSESQTLVTDAAMPAVSLVMTALAWRASRHRALDARVRRAWRIVAAAFFAYFLGNAVWFYYEIVLGLQPAVSWADAFYLSYYPLLLWGLLSFPMSQREGRTRLTFGLDAATVILGAGMLIWYYLLRPIALAGSSGFLEASVTLAFPVANTVLLFGVVAVLLRRPGVGVRRALGVLMLGIVMDAVGDLGYSYQALRGDYQGGNWPDKFYMIAFFLMALSAQYQHWRATTRAARPEAQAAPAPGFDARQPFSWLPFLGVALGYGLLLDVAFQHMRREGPSPLNELIFGAVVITGVVVARQVAAVRENVRLLKEREERRSAERFRSLVQHSSDVITVLEPDLTVTYASPSVKAVFGYEPEHLAGKNVLSFLGADERGRGEEFFSALARRSGATATVEWRLPHADGTWLSVETVAANLLEDPNVRGLVLNSRNVTERKRAEEALRESEEQLRQAQKMEAVGRLAGGVAHDFNNLLAVINGYSDLLLRRWPDADEAGRRKLEEIRKAGDRAKNLTRQLLAFSRKQVLQPVVLDLNAVVNDMEKMLRRLISEDIEVRTLLAPRLGRVKADPGQVEQVLMNLAVNARDAMPQGGRLTIETRDVRLDENYARAHKSVAPGPYVMLAVTDTGEGMDSATQARIFEPFFTTKGDGKGTGLGLSTVYGIVRQSGGSVWVYSELGRGTTFKIYLPRVDAVAEPRAARTPPELRRGSETVLLVEDEAGVRELTKEILEENGYRVVAASDGREALKLSEASAEPIQLLLTDVVMPHMGGRELADRLSKAQPQMRVLFMSGYTDDAILHHGVLDRGTALIEKPFTTEALTDKIRETLMAGAALKG
jgi:PAS domain S-box-containing protein